MKTLAVVLWLLGCGTAWAQGIGVPPAGGLGALGIGTTAGTVAAGNDSRIVGALQSSTLGQPNGVATLSSTGTVPANQLPPSSTTSVRVITGSGAVVMLAADGTLLINKTTGSPTTITLEVNPVVGVTHVIKDGKGDANTNNITISAASGTIDGVSTLVISIARGAITLQYTGTEWSVI